MAQVKTIKIHKKTKHELDKFREYINESYDELIQKLIFIAVKCKKTPKLSQETVIAIEKARKRISEGRYLTETEAKKRLGLNV